MYQRQGKAAFKKDLTNIIKLCEYLGNAQNDIKTIHIAGTNGKGSVSHILSAILQNHGFKIGLYTSPHYKDFRERIKINGNYISRTEVRQFVASIQAVLNSIQPSFFEITVAMAFWYFKKKECDFAVIETGLGGRLDSTNIITPLISVITNIGLDHQNMLGSTLEEIAGEKAGIIKKNVPLVIGEKQEQIQYIFDNKAKECRADLYFAEDLVDLKRITEDQLVNRFKASTYDGTEISCDLHGPFVQRNLITSLATFETLKRYHPGLGLSQTKALDAVNKIKSLTNYIGRWQLLSHSGETPKIIADSAHNREGLELVFMQISKLGFRRLHIVTGFVMEKEIDTIIDLFPINASYYFAKADIPRGMKTDILQNAFLKHGRRGRAYVSVKNALKAAKRSADTNDLILIVGSIFIVAEIL
jgi:dihydrofolate synthase/folylpolyglutamate synthase